MNMIQKTKRQIHRLMNNEIAENTNSLNSKKGKSSIWSIYGLQIKLSIMDVM